MEELGINAGLQDRVAQTYEGCVYMNFDRPIMEKQKHGDYERIDPTLLPQLYIAYKTTLGKVSGKVLNDIRTRYDNGDPFVIDTLKEIAGLAEQGRNAILNRDYATLHNLMNHNFDLRAKIMRISDSNMEMIGTAQVAGLPPHLRVQADQLLVCIMAMKCSIS